MEYFCLILTILYALLVAKYIQGWIRLPYFTPSREFKPLTHVNVIVPFRNELENLPGLLKCLQKQDYPAELTHFFFVNDQSTDSGDQWLANEIADLPGCTLMQGEGQGKKNALALAYKQAKGELLVTLDADCLVGINWLRTIVDYYQQTQKKLIICPVKFNSVKSFWEKLQAIEFQSLIASGAGAAANGDAIMCNGANLAFQSSLVKKGSGFLNKKEASGDDMFLLEYVKKQFPQKIGFLKSQLAMAITHPASFKQFFVQRSRWASKAKSYKDFSIIYAGVVVLLINLVLAIGLPLTAFFPDLLKPVLFTFVFKFFIDVHFLSITSPFFNTQKEVPLSLIIALLYPYYVCYSVLHGLFGKLRWKGR